MPRGQNPKSLANLKPPIRTGEVRNPEGINKKRPFSDLYFNIANEVMPEWKRRQLNKRAGGPLHPKGTTWAAADARALHAFAASGDVGAIRELADRLEGKAPRRLEITAGPQRIETTFRIVYDRRGKQYETRDEYRVAVEAEQSELAEARRIIAENQKPGCVQ